MKLFFVSLLLIVFHGTCFAGSATEDFAALAGFCDYMRLEVCASKPTPIMNDISKTLSTTVSQLDKDFQTRFETLKQKAIDEYRFDEDLSRMDSAMKKSFFCRQADLFAAKKQLEMVMRHRSGL